MSALTEAEADRALFFYSSYLMALGHQAGLRQRACLTAALIFRRFYSSRSLEAHDPLLLAPTALLVGSKVEECQAAASALERAMPKLRKDLGDETNPYSAQDMEACEQVLFEAVMFEPEAPVSCDPHAAIARHLALAMGEGDGAAGGSCEGSANVELTATACYLANDICKTALPLSVADDAIGLACVALACRMLRRPLPPPLECPGALLEQVNDMLARPRSPLHSLPRAPSPELSSCSRPPCPPARWRARSRRCTVRWRTSLGCSSGSRASGCTSESAPATGPRGRAHALLASARGRDDVSFVGWLAIPGG